MSEPGAETPIFDIKRHFDTSVTIGDRVIPIRVRRYTRAAWLEFKKSWDALMGPPRGEQPLSDEAKADREAQQLAFMEKTIVEAISIDAGHIRDDGEWVTTGSGLVDVFFSRPDVLSMLVAEVFIQNTLVPLTRKNSNSPRVSVTGSEASIPTRGGDKQGPTAASVEHSSSAASEPAAAAPESPEAAPSSSGATLESEEPIVH